MHWLLLQTISIVFRAFYSLGIRQASVKVPIKPITLSTLLLFISGIPPLLASPWYGGLDLSGLSGNYLAIFAMVLTLGIGNLIYFLGQKDVDAGTSQILLSTKLVWTVLISIVFLGFRYDLGQYIGMLLLTAAIAVIIYRKDKIEINRGGYFIMLSAVVFAVNSLVSANVANSISSVQFLTLSYFGAASLSFAYGFRDIRDDFAYLVGNIKDILYYVGGTSMINLLYFLFLYLAFDAANEQSDLVAVLTNAQVVTTVVASSLILKERDNIYRKIVAGVLVLISALMIAQIF